MSQSLTDEEIQTKREIFLIFDKQGDEKIDLSELALVLRAMDKNPLESEARLFF